MRVLKKKNAVLLIDLSNVVARAICVAPKGAFLPLFCRMVKKQRRQYRHHTFVFATEGSGTIRRQRILPDYKGGRPPAPELFAARNLVLRLLRHTDCRIIKAPDGEADDAIASFIARHQDTHVTILSEDRDLWQLICPRVAVQAKVKGAVVLIDRFACRRELGVEPKTIPLMKALLGDTSDCIPRGVARVTKEKLLRVAREAGAFNSIPKVVRNADWLSANDKKQIARAHDTVKQHLQVTRAWDDLPLKVRNCTADPAALLEFLQNHGSGGSLTIQEAAEAAQGGSR